MEWVRNKLNEIDPNGIKPVFLVGHLSAKCYYYGTEISETMTNGNVKKFYGVFRGHKNAFYLYGHVHGERVEYKDYSSCAVLHFDENDNPLSNNFGQDDSRGKEYCYSLVHMCGLRPFDVENLDTDGLTGCGGVKEKQYYPHTGTLLFAQYLVLEVFKDRAVFYVRNAGKKPGFAIDDKLAPYTVFLDDKN